MTHASLERRHVAEAGWHETRQNAPGAGLPELFPSARQRSRFTLMTVDLLRLCAARARTQPRFGRVGTALARRARNPSVPDWDRKVKTMRIQNHLVWLALLASTAACDNQKENEKAQASRQGADESAAAEVKEAGKEIEHATTETAPKAAQHQKEKVSGSDEGTTELLKDAGNTLEQMKSDPQLKKLLTDAKGVFIVPEYGRGGAIVGARGGEGVLLGQQNGTWSSPVFYDLGGVSVGAQFGAEGGEIAMLLMSDQALNSFKGDNTFSFNAEAELTLIDYAKLTGASLGKDAPDVVLWSDMEGAFAGAALAVTDVSWDDDENKAYYGKKATPEDILSGKVSKPALEKELGNL